MSTLMEELEQGAKAERNSTWKRVPVVQPTEKVKSKSGLRLAIAGGVLAVLTTAASAAYFHFRDRVSTDDAQVDARIALIAPKVFGNVSEILVADNEHVEAG